jgi:ADP-heptose:LPS heptosyltransferase
MTGKIFLETYQLVRRHLQAVFYVFKVIVPIIIRSGKKPVIFSRWSGIGDIICTFPAALEIEKQHNGREFIYNCYRGYGCLPIMAGAAQTVTSLECVGLIGRWYHFLLGGFYSFASDDDRPEESSAEICIKDFGRPFGLTLGGEHPSLGIDQHILAVIRGKLASLEISDHSMIIIHTGPSWPVREWPGQSWQLLINELRAKGFGNIIQVGTSSNPLTPGAEKIVKLEGVISLLDQMDLEETISLISMAKLFIGIDSGLLHAAAAVKTPTIGLWGATSPQFRFSEDNRKLHVTSGIDCQGCHHRAPRLHWMTGCPHDLACMKSIQVKDILENSVSILLKKQNMQPL